MFAAIEVKRTTKINNKDLLGLKAFREDYPEASTGVLYLGDEPLMINGISCIPLQSFLQVLHPEMEISF